MRPSARTSFIWLNTSLCWAVVNIRSHSPRWESSRPTIAHKPSISAVVDRTSPSHSRSISSSSLQCPLASAQSIIACRRHKRPLPETSLVQNSVWCRMLAKPGGVTATCANTQQQLSTIKSEQTNATAIPEIEANCIMMLLHSHLPWDKLQPQPAGAVGLMPPEGLEVLERAAPGSDPCTSPDQGRHCESYPWRSRSEPAERLLSNQHTSNDGLIVSRGRLILN